MKTKKLQLAFGLLCVLTPPNVVHAETDPYENAPRLYSPDGVCGIRVNGDWELYEDIVARRDFDTCLSRTYNLIVFKELEEQFRKKGWRIYNTRIWGMTPLQLVMSFYDRDIRCSRVTSEKAAELFDYILAHMTPEELNEVVETSWSNGVYWGTHAAFAAMHSATCFRKILGHPDFNSASFFNSQPALHHRIERWQPYWSLTPEECIDLLNTSRGSIGKPTSPAECITLLKELIEKHSGQ